MTNQTTQQAIQHIITSAQGRFWLSSVQNKQKLVQMFAGIMDINPVRVTPYTPQMVIAMAGAIMYFSVDTAKKTVIMEQINALAPAVMGANTRAEQNALALRILLKVRIAKEQHDFDTLAGKDAPNPAEIAFPFGGAATRYAADLRLAKQEIERKFGYTLPFDALEKSIHEHEQMREGFEALAQLGFVSSYGGTFWFIIDSIKSGKLSPGGAVLTITGLMLNKMSDTNRETLNDLKQQKHLRESTKISYS